MEITNDLFEALVSDAIDHIPDMYKEKMTNVAILIEDEPTQEQRASLGLRKCDALFGLYEGIPLPNRGGVLLQLPPDRITIFKHPMIDIFTTKEELQHQIYETLWHEVAHFFGLNHDHIRTLQDKS